MISSDAPSCSCMPVMTWNNRKPLCILEECKKVPSVWFSVCFFLLNLTLLF
jgi:hypothetical protein